MNISRFVQVVSLCFTSAIFDSCQGKTPTVSSNEPPTPPVMTNQDCRDYLGRLNQIITGADPERFPESVERLRAVYRETGAQHQVIMGSPAEQTLDRLYRLAEGRLPDRFHMQVVHDIRINNVQVGAIQNVFEGENVCRRGEARLFFGRTIPLRSRTGRIDIYLYTLTRAGASTPASEIGTAIPLTACDGVR